MKRVLLFLVTVIAGSWSYAGHECSNGGSAWTCRELTGQLRKAELRDVIEEMVHKNGAFGLPSVTLDTPSDQQILKRLLESEKLGYVRPHAARAIFQEYERLALTAKPSSTALGFTFDWDGQFDSNPGREFGLAGKSWFKYSDINEQTLAAVWCPQGLVQLEQVAVDHGKGIHSKDPISYDPTIYQGFSPVSKKALWIHESFYRYRRSICKDRTSLRARQATVQLLQGQVLEALSCEN